MGQKTHPVGFRLNVNKGWTSTWFAVKNNFAEPLEEDVKIRKYISYRLPNAGISSVEINRIKVLLMFQNETLIELLFLTLNIFNVRSHLLLLN